MRRIVVFSLEGTATLPALPPPFYPTPLDAPNVILNNELANKGLGIYDSKCFLCHGGGAVAGGMAPDLRASPIPVEKAAFATVVRDGAKAKMGMPAFPDLSDEELSSLMHYIRRQARSGLKSAASGGH